MLPRRLQYAFQHLSVQFRTRKFPLKQITAAYYLCKRDTCALPIAYALQLKPRSKMRFERRILRRYDLLQLLVGIGTIAGGINIGQALPCCNTLRMGIERSTRSVPAQFPSEFLIGLRSDWLRAQDGKHHPSPAQDSDESYPHIQICLLPY